MSEEDNRMAEICSHARKRILGEENGCSYIAMFNQVNGKFMPYCDNPNCPSKVLPVKEKKSAVIGASMKIEIVNTIQKIADDNEWTKSKVLKDIVNDWYEGRKQEADSEVRPLNQ